MALDPAFDLQFRKELARGTWIAGVDEAGRGPLAGPVVAAAVILDPSAPFIDGLDDSKVIEHERRVAISAEIRKSALAWAVREATVEEIDQHNILRASLIAMRRAIEALTLPVGLALIDGNKVSDALVRQRTIVGGDGKSPSIAAASVLAKVHRDSLMAELALRFPVYGFERHKGYPTESHREAIRLHGPCEIHRRTFSGVKEYLP